MLAQALHEFGRFPIAEDATELRKKMHPVDIDHVEPAELM